MKRLIAANWKMHGQSADVAKIDALAALLTADDAVANDVLICPPPTLLGAVALAARGASQPISVGGQDCHAETQGAFTGDVSAPMLADLSATAVIVGHSERRAAYAETDAQVRAKADAAVAAKLVPIVCVGESLAQREAGQAEAVVTAQVEGSRPSNTGAAFAVAYEPVWAIGTGKVATPEEIERMHRLLRDVCGPNVRLLYGGSVKPENAPDVFSVADVNGALVGGASLDPAAFHGIIAASTATPSISARS